MKRTQETNQFENKWYETYYSIIYTPLGEYPQTKGAWTCIDPVEEMIKDLKENKPAGTAMLVVSSRCGEIHVQEAEDWLHMKEVMKECYEAEEAYIKAGICDQCGACSLKEAEAKCRPAPVGDTGDYSCRGEILWEDQRCAQCGGIATCTGSYEGAGEPDKPACDDCCGHGNEDGHCRPILNCPTTETPDCGQECPRSC